MSSLHVSSSPAGAVGELSHPVSAPAAAAQPAENLSLRPARPDDASSCGRICFEAFSAIATFHAFPPDFPSVSDAVGLFDFMLAQPEVHVVVAEMDGQIVGSNALWEQTPIAGVGPITVDPSVQNGAIGGTLMRYVLDRAAGRALGVRLCQAAYHGRSLALYTRLGFEPREPLTVFQGAPIGEAQPDRTVRPAVEDDLVQCARLHESLHGYSRAGELPLAIARGSARVAEHEGAITGYSTSIGFFGHAVGASDEDVMALIGAARSFEGPGFLVPTRNTRLMRWCLERGLRIVQPMTLMSQGFYAEPKGAYLPSVLF